MGRDDFEKLAVDPFSCGRPVCEHIEDLVLEGLMDQVDVKRHIEVAPVTYGSDLTSLSIVYAHVLTFPNTLDSRYKHLTSQLVLACSVRGLEGGVTGTSSRRRIHRWYAGKKKIGEWHTWDYDTRNRLRFVRNLDIDKDKEYTFVEILTKLLMLVGHTDVLGPAFIENCNNFSDLVS